jgi:hypothetical protein
MWHNQYMISSRFFFFSLLIVYSAFFSHQQIMAAETALAQTLIINQVRGTECCSVGNLPSLNKQLQTLSRLDLPATFALRYDVLADPKFLAVLRAYEDRQAIDLGGFLEITPQLAADAGVQYLGDENNWYEAQFAYLIGYTQEERGLLIDTYMQAFENAFGKLPTSTTAWMIDAWSLDYLSSKYGVRIHQITREQMGVDSYTLYGGPAHYPYYPSRNWALVPALQRDAALPMIVRQTITDPVNNYGDDSSAFTSQPNDYARRQADFSYFQHLFLQAHSQAPVQDTFALIGLENSMPADIQDEYAKQLDFVAKWQSEDANNRQVHNARDYARFFSQAHEQNLPISVYAGQDQVDPSERGWWITTPSYRIRLRLSNGELFISDWRIYDPSFTDPYLEKQAKKLGWWIMPFFVDGSRYALNDESLDFAHLQTDSLSKEKLSPTRIVLQQKVSADALRVEITAEEVRVLLDEKTLASFRTDEIVLTKNRQEMINNPLLEKIQQDKLWTIEKQSQTENSETLQIKIKEDSQLLEQARLKHYPLLFPELSEHPLDPQQSYLHKNNRFAIAGRNPVRLVLFPKDQYGYPINLDKSPTIEVQPKVGQISVQKQSGQNGMIFIDLNHDQPQQFKVKISQDSWQETLNVYFAPDCKADFDTCLKHPIQGWWYINTILHDKWRALKAAWEEK